jgi:hypothetical protein
LATRGTVLRVAVQSFQAFALLRRVIVVKLFLSQLLLV